MAEIENFELETQMMGSSPVVFVDAVINAVNDYSYDACESILRQLIESDPKLDKVALRKSIHSLLNFLQDRIDKYFDKFELFCLTNVMRIPKHVKLPTDLPEPDPEDTDAKIAEMEDVQKELLAKIEAGNIALRNMKREEAALDREENELTALKQWIETAKKVCKKAGVARPKEYLSLVTGDLEELTQIVKSVKALKRQLIKLNEENPGAPPAKRARVGVDGRNLKGMAGAF